MRKKTGLTHVPTARTQPLTWEEIEKSSEPLSVRFQDVPKEWQEMAKQIKLPQPIASYIRGAGEKTIWDLLRQNNETIIFTHRTNRTDSTIDTH